MERHKLFESHYDQVAEAIDEIAERVSQPGGMAIGTTVEFAKHSSLKEAPGKNPANNMDMVKELRHCAGILIAKFVRGKATTIAPGTACKS